jgi:putative ABC transport system permease protein
MFKNYLTIAVRTLLKNKIFSMINVLGLAIGISASLVIYLLANYHFNFDKFEKDRDRIYRVVSDFNFSGEVYHNPGVMMPMGNAVRRDVTGLDEVAHFYTWDNNLPVSIPGPSNTKPTVFKKQNGIIFADSGYLKMFGYEWVAGNPKEALLHPSMLVLTVSNSKLYFPNLKPQDIIGKQVYFNDTVLTTVSGIVKDIEANTDFTFKSFISWATLEKNNLKTGDLNEWNNTNGASQLYVKLSSGKSKTNIQSQIRAVFKKYHKPDPDDHSTTTHSLQALSDVHFNADYGAYDLPQVSRYTLLGLLAIAAFLLLLGCINFINLTTAHASQRAKEIGIRKTMGSSKQQLMVQFLIETFLLTLAATLLSILLTPLILKAFSGFIPDALHFDPLKQPEIIGFLFIIIFMVSLLAGFYPAFLLSSYKPVLVLKNQAYNNTGKTRNAWLRKSLTISQFTIAQVFIMGTILVGKQIAYSINKDQGFKKEAILNLNTNYDDTVKTNKYALMEKLRQIPEITMISLCNNPPSSNNSWSGTMKYQDGKKEIETDVHQKFADSNYVKLYGLRLLAGHNLRNSDTVNSFIINETYARTLGFKQLDQAIGKNIQWSNKKIPIIAVVADFNQASIHEHIKPLAIGNWNDIERSFSIALRKGEAGKATWKTAISKIEKAWKEIYPKDEFEYSFFDESIAKYYVADQHISSLLRWATGLTIFISCLGLLGLVIYTTTQRTKEIGVRKVLGASVLQILTVISKEFIILIMIAFVIAAPLAWIGMHKWLDNFAYRTEVSWWIFLLGGTVIIIIALITLSFQTFRAAIANPVKSLRSE